MACAASDSSSKPVSTTKGTRGAAAWTRRTASSPCASGNPRSSRMMSTACSARYFSAVAHALHVRQFGVVRALLVEHLAEQTGVSGVIFDQENCLDRFHVHPPRICGGNSTLVSQKSLMLFTRRLERVQLHGLVEVAVRLELIAFHDVRFRLGRGQDDGGDQFSGSSSSLMRARTSRPSIFGRFRSSRMRSGRGASAVDPLASQKGHGLHAVGSHVQVDATRWRHGRLPASAGHRRDCLRPREPRWPCLFLRWLS